jgi:hypothetical protein
MRQAARLGFPLCHPRQICQDIAILQQFTEFDYDLSNPEFVDYFEGRTGVKISWCQCGWDHMRNRKHDWATWDEFTDCEWARKIAIWSQPNPNDEPWRIIIRAQMKDCWELWCEQHGHEDLRAWQEAVAPPSPTPEPLPEPRQLIATAQLELF